MHRPQVLLSGNSRKMDEKGSKEIDLPDRCGQIGENLGHIEEKEVCSKLNLQEAGLAAGTQKGQYDQTLPLHRSDSSNIDIFMSRRLQRGKSVNVVTIPREACSNSQILASGTPGPHLKSLCNVKRNNGLALLVEEQGQEKLKLPCLDRMEFIGENNLPHLVNQGNSLPSEDRLLRGSSVPLDTSPIIRNQQKEKQKAASDGNFEEGFSNGGHDSHGSEESCNSVGFLSKGKRRCEFQENLMAESKRIKKQIAGISASTSMIRPDSSFMNWITNIVRGCSKPIQDGAPSLELSLFHSGHGNGSLPEQTICSKSHQSSSRSIGFQNVFESLYTSNTKQSEAQLASNESKGCEDIHEVEVSGSPEIYTAKRSLPFCKDFISELCVLQSSTNVVGQCRQIEWKSSSIGENVREKKDTDVAHFSHGIAGICSSASLTVDKTSIVESQGHEIACEGGEISHVPSETNIFGSSWITRFLPQTGSSSYSLDLRKRSTDGVVKYPSNSVTVNPQVQPDPCCSTRTKCLDAWDITDKKISGNSSSEELQVIDPRHKSCFSVKEICEHNHQNAMNKQDQSLPSENVNRSEAIVSSFARRLHALKNIVPSGSKDHGTCFFCGKSIQNLSCCHSRYENSRAESTNHTLPEPSSSCFQPDRCDFRPTGSTSRQKPSVKNIHTSFDQILEKTDHPLGDHFLNAVTSSISNCQKLSTSGKGFSGQGRSSSSETVKMSPNSTEDNSVGHRRLPLQCIAGAQVGGLPKGMLDAIRRLQLSRSDIIKLMNSRASLSHTKGFFLRLRLGKWEAGLGGTGYHVACITGQAVKAVEDSKNSIYVNVGGIKCPIGSQYVSNHEFSEEELMTWWSRTMRTGGKIPSMDDLSAKLNQRIQLGI